LHNKYTLQDARNKIKTETNGDFDVVRYDGSREICQFRHNICGNSFEKRWADFIEYFRTGAKPICPDCKK